MPQRQIIATKDRLDKALKAFQELLNTQLTTNIHPDMVNNLLVEHDNSLIKLNHLAQIEVIDARTLSVTPWDHNITKKIEKAFMQNNQLNLSISSRGSHSLYITTPSLTTERRQELMKLAKQFGEQTKITIRNIRTDAKQKLEKEADGIEKKLFTTMKDQLQHLVDEANKRVLVLVTQKQKELSNI
jgi:ribosome recycling factor